MKNIFKKGKNNKNIYYLLTSLLCLQISKRMIKQKKIKKERKAMVADFVVLHFFICRFTHLLHLIHSLNKKPPKFSRFLDGFGLVFP